MAAKDAITKEYMRNAKVFADAFNFLLYKGRPVIDPDRLHAMDLVEIVLPYGEDGAVVPARRYRDNLKHLTAMEDGKAAYLVLLFGPEPWDGPMSIHEMLADVEEELLPFIADYRINLIAPASVDAESMNRFQSSLREVLLYIKYSRDRKQLKNLRDSDSRYREPDLEAALIINTVTNSKLKLDRKKGKIDMCLVIEEMRRESRLEGERLGE